ncbi:hypothetical protein GF327_08135 [Candidatus Woesearchaeota archaeon]|nr:hypothetical protein [Candidatus Woesearchaeota archaeon]
MQNIIKTLLLLLLCVPFTHASFYNTDSPHISGAFDSISPYPVEPGQDFTIKLRIYNDGGELGEDVSVSLDFDQQFFLKSKDEKFDEVFDLCVGCSKNNIYYFTVKPETVSGDYPIIAKIKRNGVIIEEKLLMRVIGQPEIIFDSKLLNETVTTDGRFSVVMNIKNVGTGIARNIKIKPITQGFVMDNSNLLYVEKLTPKQDYETEVSIMSSDDLDNNPSRLTFSMDYINEKSESYNYQQDFGLDLIDLAGLYITSIKIDAKKLSVGKEFLLTVRLENQGEGIAKKISLLIESEKIEGIKRAYLGELEESEDTSAFFWLTPNDDGIIEMDYLINYEDDLGLHQSSQNLKINVDSKSHSVFYLFGLLIIVIVGYIFYKIYVKGKYKNG